MEEAGFTNPCFPLLPQYADESSESCFPLLPQYRNERSIKSPMAEEGSSSGQPMKGDAKGKGPLKPVETMTDIEPPMERGQEEGEVGGEDISCNYNVETMADIEPPMERGQEEGEVGGEDTIFRHNYNADPMPDTEIPLDGEGLSDGNQGRDVGREDVVGEEDEADEDLTEDPGFRESDVEDEDEEEDLFFRTTDNDAYESELRAWLGRELGGRDQDMSDHESEDANSETLRSLTESSDNDGGFQRKKRCRYPQFNEETDLQGEVMLEKGMEFTNHKLFKEALREYAIQKGFDYDFQHNESKVLAATCKKKCGWYIRASLSANKSSFQIKTFKKEHTCGRQGPSSKIDYKWLAKKYMEEIRDMPKMDIGAFQNMVAKNFGVEATRSQCYRARKRALQILEGDSIAQYRLLWNYCHILLETNPGSSIKMKADNGVFQRLYVCFAACKDGFKNCRPVIGLDGCHIKGGFPGQLLCAIGIDANDNMFPIAYAIVEVENTTSWAWFVENLLTDVGSVEENKWIFMSDQQKGLVNILADYVEPKDHRICVRHLYENFKKKYPGREFKNALWACARATTEVHFKWPGHHNLIKSFIGKL